MTALNAAVVAGSLCAFVFLTALVGASPNSTSHGVFARLLVEPRYWLCVLLLLVACLAPVVAAKTAALHLVPAALLPPSERLALRLSRGAAGGADLANAEPRALFGQGRSARRAKKDF